MPAPRINPALLSPALRAQLAKVQAELNLGSADVVKAEGGKTTSIRNKTIRRKKETLSPEKAETLIQGIKVSEDGNEVTFLIDADPSTIPTAQGKGAFVDKSGHVHFFTKPKQRKAEKTFQDAFSKHTEHTRRWGDVPIEVEFTYFFSYPSGTPKRELHRIGPMMAKPDAPNVSKGICDALTRAGMWSDDAIIGHESSKKFRTTNKPHIVIKVKNLQPMFDEFYKKERESLITLGLG